MSVIDICFRVIIKPFLKLPFFPNFIGRKFLKHIFDCICKIFYSQNFTCF